MLVFLVLSKKKRSNGKIRLHGKLNDALMLKRSYVERGDISKAEQMTLKSIEAKVKERLADEEVA